jgi:hypothetical protein
MIADSYWSQTRQKCDLQLEVAGIKFKIPDQVKKTLLTLWEVNVSGIHHAIFLSERYGLCGPGDKYNERIDVYCRRFGLHTVGATSPLLWRLQLPNAAINFMNTLQLLCGELFAYMATRHAWLQHNNEILACLIVGLCYSGETFCQSTAKLLLWRKSIGK